MPNKFLPPTTTTATRTAATPIDGEILYDTDEKKLYYGNGTTQGGKATGSSIVSDSEFRIQDNSDATKQIAFEASGITTGATRTLTPPDASGTIALIDTTGISDKDLFYYDASSKLFKRIAIGTTDQALIAKPSLDPPFQFATLNSSSSISICKQVLQTSFLLSSGGYPAVSFVSGGLKISTLNIWSNSNPTRFTIATNGNYQIMAGGTFSVNGSGLREFLIKKNGANFIDGATRVNPVSGGAMIGQVFSIQTCVAGDYFEFVMSHNAGSSLTVYGESDGLYLAAFVAITKLS